MKGTPEDAFRHMESLFHTWLEGARDREILRLLELFREELGRRGQLLRYQVRQRSEQGDLPD